MRMVKKEWYRALGVALVLTAVLSAGLMAAGAQSGARGAMASAPAGIGPDDLASGEHALPCVPAAPASAGAVGLPAAAKGSEAMAPAPERAMGFPTVSSGWVKAPPVHPPDGAVTSAPELAAVLWDQPLSAVNQNAYVDQDFSDLAAFSSYLADDFTNPAPWTIEKIFVPGLGWNGFTTLMNATSLTWAIYADAAGVPDGYPGGGNAPVWTLTLPPADPQVSIAAGWGGQPSDTTLTLAAPVSLPAGTWWLVFYPAMPFSGGGQFGRQAADTANGAWGQIINPGGGFGIGTAWQNWTVLGMAQQDIAFRLEGQTCSSTVTINMTALGGTTTDWPVTHGSQTTRLFRDGVPSTCAAPKAVCPGTFGSGSRAYDAFSFTNSGVAPACITTTLATPCTGANFLFMVAYLGPFDPANICTDYLADVGSSPNPSITMSFTVPAGGTFTLVVAEVTQGAGCPAGYTLTVDGLSCGVPTCPAITLAPATLPLAILGVPYNQALTAAGGTAPYTFAVTAGALPPGLTLAPDGTLSGTLTAIGAYAFTVTATDSNPLICTGEQAYTLGTYSTFFLDDAGRSKLCVNRMTGAYTWEIMAPPGVGVYTGVANILNGGTKIYSKPGDPNRLNCTYDPIRKRASGYFYTPAGDYSRLADLNTANNAGGCP